MKKYIYENAKLQSVSPPERDKVSEKIFLSPQTIEQRKSKTLQAMEKHDLDVLVIYADLEHGSNFEYLSGFLPRFEEALLVIHRRGELYYLLGNENVKLAKHAHLEGRVIRVPEFSLPNQPMIDALPLSEVFKQAEIQENHKVGLVGWKLFSTVFEKDPQVKELTTNSSRKSNQRFDLPHFIVSTLADLLVHGHLSNATGLFIGNEGIRRQNNANELVHYAFGAELASRAILTGLDTIDLGKTEMDVASHLDLYGQPKSVVTITATGQRFEHANLYPSFKTLKMADSFAMTIGYKGGLQSRSGYLCATEDQLPSGCEDYLDKVVKPYFTAVTAWIENIAIGMTGKVVYKLIEEVLPSQTYGWSLNPGHLIGTEEWMASPIYKDSEELLQSGMMLQIDIIPSIPGYGGTSAECGIALADDTLKAELAKAYPDFYKGCEQRKAYLKEVLGITISKDVLLLSNAALYMRPLMLSRDLAMTYGKA